MDHNPASGLGERMRRLSPEQRRLLELRLREAESRSPTPRPTIPRRTGCEAARVTAAQRRLWLFAQQHFSEGNAGAYLYNVPRVFQIDGPLDIGRLRQALSALFARHEALRTVFREVGGEPVQIIQPAAEIEFSVID